MASGSHTPTGEDSIIGKPFKFVDSSHSYEVLAGLHRQRENDIGLDFTLVIEGSDIAVHRNVLMAFCPYFEALLGPNMKEGRESRVELQELKLAPVREIIDYAYTGEILLSDENVESVLETANYLGIVTICGACCDFLKSTMNASTCCDILHLAINHDQLALQHTAEAFFLENFPKIRTEKTFYDLEVSILANLLQNDKLRIAEPQKQSLELLLLQAVIDYARSVTLASKDFVNLLNSVRLSQIDHSDLQRFSSEDIIARNPGAQELIEKALRHDCKELSLVAKDPWNRIRLLQGLKFSPSQKFAGGGQVRPIRERFDHRLTITDITSYVVGMDLFFRRWDGRPVLGGLKVHYSNGESIHKGGIDYGYENHSFRLESDERIVAVDCNCGWMIDKLTFFTTKDRSFGPFGGPGGGAHRTAAPDMYGYLSYITGGVVHNQGSLGITELIFVWGHYQYDPEEEAVVAESSSPKVSSSAVRKRPFSAFFAKKP